MPGTPPPSAGTSAGRHRVLASPTRVRVLEVVGRHPGGIDAGRIASTVGFHVNTVRAHLEILEHVGLVRSEREDRHHRGRPRRLFRTVATSGDEPDAEDDRDDRATGEHRDGQEAYRALATALAAAAQDPSPDRMGAATAAGWRWGQVLVTDAAADAGAAGPPALPAIRNRLRELLEQLGFAPSVMAPDRIELRRCPFLDAAREHPEVVCGLHRGILAGALEALGYDGGIGLDPFTTPTTCEVRFGHGIGSAA